MKFFKHLKTKGITKQYKMIYNILITMFLSYMFVEIIHYFKNKFKNSL